MGRPSYDEATLAAYFHGPADDLFDDPVVGALLRRLTLDDRDLLDAIADVDRSQIRDAMTQTPWERLQFVARSWNGLARLRRAD
jgi:hypothetical protein